MNFEKVIFAFLIILALALNVSFFLGEIDQAAHHHVYELVAALIVSLLCTILKFGDRSSLGASVLASSLVATLMLIAAATVLFFAEQMGSPQIAMASITSLAGGALSANILSVILLVIETSQLRR